MYVHSRIDGEWSEVAIINAMDGEPFFDGSLALSGNTLVVSSSDNAFSISWPAVGVELILRGTRIFVFAV